MNEFPMSPAENLPWNSKYYSGWGGHEYFHDPPGTDKTPVVFVPGNNRDADDWIRMASSLRHHGYQGDAIWSITFRQDSPRHDEMAAQLESFISNVKRETGSDEVDIVSHSLGVTGVRWWIDQYKAEHRVRKLIGLAGANHGLVTSKYACKIGYTRGKHRPSCFIRSDYREIDGHPLARLNQNETPGDIEYFMVRGKYDPLYLTNSKSPFLHGATNLTLPTGHEGVRTGTKAQQLVTNWLTKENDNNE